MRAREIAREALAGADAAVAIAAASAQEASDKLAAEAELRRWLGADLDNLIERVEALERDVAVLTATDAGSAADDDTSTTWSLAIEREIVLSFDYEDAEGRPSHRVVSPYDITDGTLTAFDHTREAMRRFRIERITNVLLQLRDEFRQPPASAER